MKKIDAERLIQNNDIVQVVSKYVSLKREGVEHVGICPFHDDTHSSLKVRQEKNVYKCFACGAGGDTIDFLMRLGRTFHEAVEELNGGVMPDDITPEHRTVAHTKPNSWKHVNPAPVSAGLITHYKHGRASQIWTYRNQYGAVIGHVARFDLPESKEVLPYVYATDGTRSEWRWMGFEKPRPLYNLDRIAANPEATIIVCEGEKTADAIQKEITENKTVATTWIGGANGIDNADFTPLRGRNIVFWPDHDTKQRYPDKHPKAHQLKPWYEQPGNAAMLAINEKISAHCPVRMWVNVPEGYPHKWDAADKEWEPGELKTFIRDNKTDVPTYEKETVSDGIFEADTQEKPKRKKLEGPKNPPPPPRTASKSKNEEEKNRFSDNEHFRMLGYDKDENSRLVYFFFSFEAKAVIKLSPSSMTKSNLMMLAPINWWEQMFPGKSKVDVDSAQQFLLTQSHNVGTFKEKFIRGRGAWIDEGKFIIHTGDVLLVDGELVPLRHFRSRYVYEIGERLGYGTSQPMQSSDAYKLIEKIKWLMWEREINSYLLAGWCVIAPFCGVLQWRPHIWVTGPAGSGKSWTMDNVIKRLLGETALVVQGKTTEAGVRGLLQNDARAVLFDESDVDNNNDKERIQNILALARSSSYHDGGLIGKGTQTGASRTYTMRSCFAFSSIGVQLNQQSDRSRFTMLGLVSFEGKRTKEEFMEFEREWMNLVTDDFVRALQSRTMKLLPVIIKNARTFADAVAHIIGQRRIGDQVGGMLAGAYSLSSSKEITYDEAVEWVKQRDWSEEKGLELTKDEYRLFGKLMGHMIRIESDSHTIDRSVGEIILLASNLRSENGVTQEMAQLRLRRMGIIVKGDKIYISNTADGISSIIKDTGWASNYNKILERLPGAQREEPKMYYPGIKSRGVSVPLGMVAEGLGELPRQTNYWAQQNATDVPF